MAKIYETQRTIEEVFDMETGEIIESKEFFKRPESEIFKFRRELELSIKGYSKPKFVCIYCNQLVKLTGKATRRGEVSFFAHLHDSDDCEIKTDGENKLSQKEIEILKYSKCRESERHKELKNFIFHSLNEGKSKNKGIVDVNLEKRIFTRVPHYNWRQPDISFNYKGKKVVIELQLSTTFLGVIVERDVFYKMNNTFIIWVFNFSDNQQFVNMGNMMCKDIYYSNKRNAFILDEETMKLSSEKGELILKCVWFEPKITNGVLDLKNSIRKEEFVSLDQLTFDKENYKPYFVDADILFSKYQLGSSIQRKNDELQIEKDIRKYITKNEIILTPIYKYGKWGFENKQNDLIIQPLYYEVLPFRFGISWVRKRYWGAIDTRGRRIVNFEFKSIFVINDIDKIIAENNVGKYGVLSIEGFNVIPFEYTSIKYLENKNFEVVKNSRSGVIDIMGNVITEKKELIAEDVYKGLQFEYWGLENSNGKVILPYKYDNLENFVDGKAAATRYYRDGYVNIFGQEISDPIIKISDHTYKSKRFELWGIEDDNGDIILPFEFSDMREFRNGKSIARSYNNGNYGVVDYYGEIIIPFDYESIENFENGIAKATKNRRKGLLSVDGYEIIEEISILNDQISKGKKFEKWGLIGNNGDEILPFTNREINNFEGKYASVRGDNSNWGIINSEGKLIIQFDFKSIGTIFEDKFIAQRDSPWGTDFWGIVNIEKEIEILFEFEKMRGLYEGLIAVKPSKNRSCDWGVIDFNENLIIPLEYKDIDKFSTNLIKAKKNDGWGVINEKGEIIIPFEYDQLGRKIEDVAFASKNGKYGCLNALGEIVIPFEFDYISDFEAGKAKVKKNYLFGFIDTNGNEIIPINYDEIYDFKEGKAKVRKDKLYGYLDLFGNEFIPIIYNSIGLFNNEIAVVEKGRKFGCIDKIGNEITPIIYDKIFDFKDGKAKVEKDKLYGYINIFGKEIISIRYSSIEILGEFTLKAKINGLWGVLDWNENINIPFKYDSIEISKNGNLRVSKHDDWGFIDEFGYEILEEEIEITKDIILAKKFNEWGVINTKKEEIIPFEYRIIRKFADGIAQALKGDFWGCIDINGNTIIPFEYNSFEEFINGKAKVKKNGKWGYIDTYGNTIIPFEYNSIEEFINGKANAEKGDFWGCIDINGNTIIPFEYDYINEFINGRAIARKDCHYGYIDHFGNTIIPFEYTHIYKFIDGKAIARKDWYYGSIDINGNTIIPFEYKNIEEFIDGRAIAQKEYYWGYIDLNGNIIIPFDYTGIKKFIDGKAFAQKNNYWGYIDLKGNTIIPFKYDYIDEFINEISNASKDGKRGIIDINGNELIEDVEEIENGYIKGTKFGKWGIFNKSDDIIIPFEYDLIWEFKSGIAKAKKKDKYGFFDINGNNIIPFEYSSIEEFINGKAKAVKGDKYGFIDINGNIIIPFEYNSIEKFIDGKAKVKKHGKWGQIDFNGFELIEDEIEIETGYLKGKRFGKWGICTKSNEIIIPFKYDSIGDFKDGCVKAQIGGNYGNWGCIDICGNIIIPFLYISIGEFINCKAKANKGGKFGYIDINGNVLIENIEEIDNGYIKGSKFEKWGISNKSNEIIIPYEYDEFLGNYNGGILALKNKMLVKIPLDLKANKLNLEISSIADFGLFLKFSNSFNGLLHINEIKKIGKSISDYSSGEFVEVYICSIDTRRNKVSLSFISTSTPQKSENKRLDINSLQIGERCDGIITSIAPFGLFVKIKDEFTALLHISELKKRGKEINEYTVNDQISVSVLLIDKEKNKATLML